MKRMAMMLCVIVVALLCIQVPAKAQFGIYGGLALPTGDFGSTDANDKAGRAKSGFCGGLELNFGLPMTGPIDIGIIISATALYNEYDISGSGSTKVSADPWLTGWPMIGGRVGMKLDQLSFYGTLQLGGVIAKFPELTYGSTKYTSDPVVKFVAFSVGAGVGFGPLRLGLRYLDAGEVEFEIKSGSSTQGGTSKPKLPISALCITVGIEI